MQYGIIYSLVVTDKNTGKGWEIQDLAMSFEVTKDSDSSTSQSNHATIRVWNLSKDKQKTLERGKTQAVLKVGYQPSGLTYLFSGEAVSVYTLKEGPDVITELKITPAFTELSAIRLSHTIPEGKTVKDVIDFVVSKVPSIKKVTSRGEFLSKQLTDGFSILGSPYVVLNNLSNSYKLEWNIDGETLYVSDKGASWELRPDKGFVINQSSGLIGRPYKDEDKTETNSSQGLSFTCLLNPKLVAGGIVRLEYEELTDFYKIESVRFSGHTHQPGSWISEVKCSRYTSEGNRLWAILLRPDKTGGHNVSSSNIS